MHLARVFTAAAAVFATLALAPSAMATNTLYHPPSVRLVRGIGGHFGGPSFRGGGFRGGYAWRGGWGYHPWHRGFVGVYPYAYGCPYTYSYAYCTWPNG